MHKWWQASGRGSALPRRPAGVHAKRSLSRRRKIKMPRGRIQYVRRRLLLGGRRQVAPDLNPAFLQTNPSCERWTGAKLTSPPTSTSTSQWRNNKKANEHSSRGARDDVSEEADYISWEMMEMLDSQPQPKSVSEQVHPRLVKQEGQNLRAQVGCPIGQTSTPLTSNMEETAKAS